MSRLLSIFGVIVCLAIGTVVFVEGAGTDLPESDDFAVSTEHTAPQLTANGLQNPSAKRQPSQERLEADPRPLGPQEDLDQRLAKARTVAEVIALLAGTPPHDAEQRVANEEKWLAKSLQSCREALTQHRATSNPNDPDDILAGKKMQADVIDKETILAAMRRRDLFFAPLPVHGISERFSANSFGGSEESPAYMMIVRRRDASSLLEQLNLEIDYAQKVAEFNSMTEPYRRRILAHRENSLLDGSPEKVEWLKQYFPKGSRIDKQTATIH